MNVPARGGWLVVAGLALGVCVSNGFARFAYGLILPAMREDLGWSYTQAGWINTSNALGYLLGAVLTFVTIARAGAARLFIVGILATSLSLLASGFTHDIAWLTLWRLLAGVFGAPVFIAGSAMAATLFVNDPARNALAIALYFGGGGLGMILSGVALPIVFAQYGADAWPTAWMLLGFASLACCPLCVRAATRTSDPRATMSESDARRYAALPLPAMRYALIAYGLFATGYIVYLTFLVAWMQQLSAGPHIVAGVWITIGIGIMLSPFVWKGVLARFDSGVPLAAATGVVAIGTLIPVILPTTAGLFASACLFGIAVFIAPGAVTSFSRKNLPRQSWGRAVGLFTGIFAIGQSLGPVASGRIGDVFGGIEFGFAAAGIVLCAGALIALAQRPLAPVPDVARPSSSQSSHPGNTRGVSSSRPCR